MNSTTPVQRTIELLREINLKLSKIMYKLKVITKDDSTDDYNDERAGRGIQYNLSE